MKAPCPKSAKAFFDLAVARGVVPDVLLDLGVGYPESEAWVCKKRFPACCIIGVEPHVGRYESTRAGYPGELLNIAVGAHKGKLQGFLGKPAYPEPHSNFKLVVETGSEKSYVKHEIDCTCVDELDRQYGPFEQILLWADIEGSELLMLQGATAVLKAGRVALINLELLTLPGWRPPAEVYAFLAEYDYTVVGRCQRDRFFARKAFGGGVHGAAVQC